MNQDPGGWGMRFNPGQRGMHPRFGMQMGGPGMNMNMMNGQMNPRFGMMNQNNMNMMNQNMNMMNQNFRGQRFGGGNMGFGPMNNAGFNQQARFRGQNPGMGNFGPGMRFGGPNTGMDNAGKNQGVQDMDLEDDDDGATPAKVAKKDTKHASDEKSKTESRNEKKETKKDDKEEKKETKSNEDPKPDIEKLKKYHIPRRDSNRDEDASGKTDKTGDGPVSILDHSFDNKHKTDSYNRRLNENVATKGPRPGMKPAKDNKQNSYNVRKSGFNPKNDYRNEAGNNNPAMFGRNNRDEENFKAPMPLMGSSFNKGQHGGRNFDQPMQGIGNFRGPQAFVQSQDSLKSVSMKKKNLSFANSEYDQDFDAEEDADQQEEDSEGEEDYDDEGIPTPAFNPMPNQLVMNTSMPVQMSSSNTVMSGSFIRGRTLHKEDIDPRGKGLVWSGNQPSLAFSVEKNSRPALLNIDSYPPIDSNNIGNIMLCQMGWTPGTGLGLSRMGIMDPVTAAGRLGGRHGLGGLPAQEQKMMKTDIKKPRVAPFKSLKTQSGKDNIIKYVQEQLNHLNSGTKTPVAVLMEYLIRRKKQAEFRPPLGLEETSRDESFARQCVIDDKYYETGTGTNKKDAKTAAALNAFRALVRELYQEIGMAVPPEVERQLRTAPGSEKQRPTGKPSRWSKPVTPGEKREDILTRQPDPLDKKKLTLTPALEDLVKKFYEGMKHTINALTECCQQQSIKLEFKDTEGNEQAHHGCKILLDEVEYGFAISKGKKSAKSDAALIAFVAYVKDLYNNSDQPLPNSFTSLCRLGLSRLEQLESAAKARAKAESLARLQQMQPKRSILKQTARQPTFYETEFMGYDQAQGPKRFQAPNQGFQASNQGFQVPQVPKKGILKQTPNQAPQFIQGGILKPTQNQGQVNQEEPNQGPKRGILKQAQNKGSVFNQGQQNQAPDQGILKQSQNEGSVFNKGQQNKTPDQGILKKPLSEGSVFNKGQQNKTPDQSWQHKAANQDMQNQKSNKGPQSEAPNKNQPSGGLSQIMQYKDSDQALQNMASYQGIQMSDNQASMSVNKARKTSRWSSQDSQEDKPVPWNQSGNTGMGSQKKLLNQWVQSENIDSGTSYTAKSDSKQWLEVPPPEIYKPKFPKFPDKDKASDKKAKDNNAISFYEAERIINAKLERDWEEGKADIGAEMPEETVSKLFAGMAESQTEKKPRGKKFEKPATKVNYCALVQKASKKYGKNTGNDSQSEEKKIAPWDQKKPATKQAGKWNDSFKNKPAEKWTDTSKNTDVGTWSRKPKNNQAPIKKSVSESSLETCQSYQGMGSILQRLAADGDLEPDNEEAEEEEEEEGQHEIPQGLSGLIQKLGDEGAIERQDSSQNSGWGNPGMRRPASMTALDRQGNQGSLRSRLAGLAGGYDESFGEEDYREADYNRGGGFPQGPMQQQNRFNQPRANNPFMSREPGFLSQNPGRPGAVRPLMGMGPPKPFMAVRPMMSQQMGAPKSLLDLQFDEPPEGVMNESGLKPPSFKQVQNFYDGTRKALLTLKDFCKQNKVKLNFKAGSFEKWQKTGVFERQAEISGRIYDVGEGTTKAEAEEDAALMAFRAILRDFNLDQG